MLGFCRIVNLARPQTPGLNHQLLGTLIIYFQNYSMLALQLTDPKWIDQDKTVAYSYPSFFDLIVDQQ